MQIRAELCGSYAGAGDPFNSDSVCLTDPRCSAGAALLLNVLSEWG